MSMDENNDGRLSYEELKNGYKKVFGDKMTEEQLFDLFGSIDKDCSGFIDY